MFSCVPVFARGRMRGKAAFSQSDGRQNHIVVVFFLL